MFFKRKVFQKCQRKVPARKVFAEHRCFSFFFLKKISGKTKFNHIYNLYTMSSFDIATQIGREKINFTFSFPEPRPRMAQVLSRANAAFSEYTGTEFSCCLGMVFNASKQYWSPLEHTAQLLSGGQLYLFQADVNEVPGVIPDAKPGDHLLINYSPSRGASVSPSVGVTTRGPSAPGARISPAPTEQPTTTSHNYRSKNAPQNQLYQNQSNSSSKQQNQSDSRQSAGGTYVVPQRSVSAVSIAEYHPAACPTATARQNTSHNGINRAGRNPCSPFHLNDPSTFGQGPRVHQQQSATMYSSSSSEPRASPQRANLTHSHVNNAIGVGYRYKQGGGIGSGGRRPVTDPYSGIPMAGDSLCRVELEKEAKILDPARTLDNHRTSVRSETHNFVATCGDAGGVNGRSSSRAGADFGRSSSAGGFVPSPRMSSARSSSAGGHYNHSYSSYHGGRTSPRRQKNQHISQNFTQPTPLSARGTYYGKIGTNSYANAGAASRIRPLPPNFQSSIQRIETIKENNILHPSHSLETHRGLTRGETREFTARQSPMRMY